MSDTLNRTIRTILQVVASGGLTAMVATVADGLSPVVSALVLAVWMIVVTFAQNALEEKEIVPTFFKPDPGLDPTPHSS